MPFTMPYPDPTADDTLDHCYIWAAEINLNFSTQYGRIVYFIHRDEAAANAGKDPIGVIAFDLTPTGTPEVRNDANEVTEPAFPSFNMLMYENQQAFGAIAQAVYGLLMSRPKYSGATFITRPTVSASTPADGGTAAGITTITITFDMDIDPNTIDFQLIDSTDNPVATTMSYTNKVATFTASAALAAGTYTATLNTAKTVNKDSLEAPVVISFTAT